MSFVNQKQGLAGLIRCFIYEETMFLKHWIAKVVDNNDTTQNGCVQVEIDELGWNDIQIWARPRQGNGMSVPAIGTYVEIYFMGGDQNRAVYLFPAVEIQGNTPSGFGGKPTDHLLFQDPANSLDTITFNSMLKEYSVFDKLVIDTTMMSPEDGTYKTVRGQKLDEWLDELKIWLDTHTHNFIGTGTVQAPPTQSPQIGPDYLSEIIKGS